MFKPGITVWYSVQDLQRTLDFYTEKLGFSVTFHDPESSMAMVDTNTPGVLIGFSEAQEVVPSTSSTVFEVSDVVAARQSLESRGVSFQGEIDTIPDMVTLATFTDPDGHSLMLSEDLTQP